MRTEYLYPEAECTRGRMVSFHADRRRRSVRLSGEEGDRLCGKTNPHQEIRPVCRQRSVAGKGVPSFALRIIHLQF